MEIRVKLIKELIKVDDCNSELMVSSEDAEDLYLSFKDNLICIGTNVYSEGLKVKFSNFCVDIYFATKRYESTSGQFPTNVLFNRDDSEPACLRLKPEFFSVEVD